MTKMEIAIEDLVFMDNDTVVFTEGINESLELYGKNKPIDPVTIFHQQDGKYYARGGRHRTYMIYNRIGLRTIPVEVLEKITLYKCDQDYINNGCVTVHDLVEEPLYTEE
jgi:uncharacterized ParB-like nuclease family protein